MFVFQFASRRVVSRELTCPQFEADLRPLFPELETLLHADTLYRLLRDIDVAHLEQAHIELLQRLIRAKTFRRYLIDNAYPIAIDGSQKFARDRLWNEHLPARQVGARDARYTQYFVYVLEASLAFRNGLTIPLLSEFLDDAKGDTHADKQDCELRGFARQTHILGVLGHQSQPCDTQKKSPSSPSRAATRSSKPTRSGWPSRSSTPSTSPARPSPPTPS